LTDVDALARKARCFIACVNGKKALDAGYQALVKARTNSTYLHEAKSCFLTAEAALAEAANVLETGAEPELRKVKGELKKVVKLIRPFELDAATRPDLTDLGTDWVYLTQGGRTWAQAKRPKGMLLSGVIDFPHDFTLRVDFCLVNHRKQLAPRDWQSYPDLFTIGLMPKDPASQELQVSLGRNTETKLKFASFACIKVNGKVFDLRHLQRGDGMVTLVLRKQNSDYDIVLNGHHVTTLSVESDFDRLAVSVNNGLDLRQNPIVFPAITRIAVTALEPAAGKAAGEGK
jgi:hypothetical protein